MFITEDRFRFTVPRSEPRRGDGLGRNPRKLWAGLVSGDCLCPDGTRAHVLEHITSELRHYRQRPRIQVRQLRYKNKT